ncbi:PREDICTED: membrane-spanning 4-domains subfamily A member 12-like [Hipposideros armiger]|uniref:Membrane-spanning 4-domains subfamily A member 12-like n=1 Tax=Hipposideros armiger TaxID=186990 RepID=A0A8B7SDW7_HIPAR|nr:PREDICTED: membrane-spanning 4-domains subfamily A member 12-like [Hipposideros armiger]
MMSTNPTTHPPPHEATQNPYQPPPGFIYLGNQVQSNQPHIITSPGIFANCQQGQGNVQMITPAVGIATSDFKEEAKTLGMKGSKGMNIVSAIFSFIGIILFLVDLSLNGHPNQDYWALIAGRGISAMLMIFSLVEFCITCTTAHFASQVITSTPGSVLVYANNP